jgi:hypothetical protein
MVMDDEQRREEIERDGATAERSAPAAARTTRRWRRWPFVVAGILLVPVLLLAAWTAITLSYSYSTGERAGFIQKFSQKGWVCKTWEGEIAMVNMPGAAQERFSFSVRSDSIARQITKLMGSRVALTYEQHRGVPGSCFGETEYYVTGVQAVP